MFYSFFREVFKKYGNIPVKIYAIGFSTLFNFLITLLFGSSFKNLYIINEIQIYALLMLIIPGGVLMLYCWGKALQLISPTQAAISLGFNPLSAILPGSIILNEEITLRLILGFISIVIAITLANWKLNK